MKIFVSYSFRPENAWVETYVIPLIRHFGHEVVTGRMLDAGALDDEVKKKVRQCRRVICFVTRATPRYGPGGAVPVSYEPPVWVHDELIAARANDLLATEYRETLVEYGGAATFHSHHAFDRDSLPDLLLDVAEMVSSWPVGPLTLRLSFPDAIQAQMVAAANAGTLQAECTAVEDDQEVGSETVRVHLQGGQLVALFWLKPKPTYSINVVVRYGAQNLARRGISPVVAEASLIPV
jgi:hypothetical protein